SAARHGPVQTDGSPGKRVRYFRQGIGGAVPLWPFCQKALLRRVAPHLRLRRRRDGHAAFSAVVVAGSLSDLALLTSHSGRRTEGQWQGTCRGLASVR